MPLSAESKPKADKLNKAQEKNNEEKSKVLEDSKKLTASETSYDEDLKNLP